MRVIWGFGSGGGAGGSGSVSVALDDVTDVVLTAAATGDILSFNGTNWVNSVPALSNRADDDGTVSLLSTDRAKAVFVGHATANAVSIAQAGTAGFEAGYFTYLCTTGAGTTTLTPTTSTINGTTTLTLREGDCALIISNGTNYIASVASRFSQFTYMHVSADGGVLEDTDDVPDIWIAKFPMRITQICGRADTGTSTFNIQKDDGSAASIAASNIVADTTEACTSTFTAGENIVATGNALDFLQVTGATSGSPTRITVTVSYVRI